VPEDPGPREFYSWLISAAGNPRLAGRGGPGAPTARSAELRQLAVLRVMLAALRRRWLEARVGPPPFPP